MLDLTVDGVGLLSAASQNRTRLNPWRPPLQALAFLLSNVLPFVLFIYYANVIETIRNALKYLGLPHWRQYTWKKNLLHSFSILECIFDRKYCYCYKTSLALFAVFTNTNSNTGLSLLLILTVLNCDTFHWGVTYSCAKCINSINMHNSHAVLAFYIHKWHNVSNTLEMIKEMAVLSQHFQCFVLISR